MICRKIPKEYLSAYIAYILMKRPQRTLACGQVIMFYGEDTFLGGGIYV
jgi:tRNA U34 2-thiouridine synthase MnmA/TrmU